jgi:hypothetical protein
MIVTVLVVLLVVGLLFWAIDVAPFLDGTIKSILKVILIVCLALWLLSLVGILPRFR